MLTKLRKLKDKGIGELVYRARQAASRAAESAGVSTIAAVPTDEALLAKFDLSDKSLTAYFADRDSTFYPSFNELDETLTELKARFPSDVERIVKQADRIREGRFDLLGYQDLAFGGAVPNWHLDPVSGKSSPRVHWSRINETSADETGDKKVIWELNRHQYFCVLGQAYRLTGDEKYAETFVSHVEDWIANNPPKIGVNWLSSLEVAFRSISWIWAFYFFKDSPNFSDKLLSQMLKVLYLSGRHIETYLSTYFSPNTHLTGEALGLCMLGGFLRELDEGRRWKQLGYKILLDSLDFQVRDDGGYCEQASHYHRYTADFYLNLMVLRQAIGEEIDEKHRSKLSRLLDFLLFITQPNGETPLYGDDDGGRLYFFDDRPIADFRPTLALGAALFDRPDLKFAAGDPTPELLWLLGPSGLREYDAIDSTKPGETSRAFNESGFFTFRDDWTAESGFLLIDCGDHGFLNCGHAHADALGFVLSVDGVPLFIDSGTFNYTSDLAARDAFRSGGHNCLTIDGESSSVPGGPFSWKSIAKSGLLEWVAGEDGATFRGTNDGFARIGVDHERKIVYGRDPIIEVADVLSSPDKHAFEVNFILSPEFQAKSDGTYVSIYGRKNGKPTAFTLDTEVVHRGTVERSGWTIKACRVSERYGRSENATRLTFLVEGKGGIEVRTRLSRTST